SLLVNNNRSYVQLIRPCVTRLDASRKSSFAGCDNGLQIFSIKLLLRNRPSAPVATSCLWPRRYQGLS
ncbi:hypothetical protein EE612_057283, partial [Oryza sativa]